MRVWYGIERRTKRRRSLPLRRAVLISFLLVFGLLLPPPLASAQEPEPDATVGQYLSYGFGGPGWTYRNLPAGVTPDGTGRIVGIPGVAGSPSIGATSPQICNPGGLCYYLSLLETFVVADSELRGTLTAIAGGGQTTAPEQPFGTPLSARLTDSAGVLAASTEVVFTVTQGSASFGTGTTATVRTDTNGIATAPTLTAGSTTGPVVVEVSQPGSTSAVFMLTVVQSGPARADLVVSLQAPATAGARSSFDAGVTVRNRGPAAATRALAVLVVPRGLTVTNTGGGTARGPVIIWSLGTVAADSTSTRTVRLTPGSRTGRALLVAGAFSGTRDPQPLNNVAVRSVRLG